MVTQFNAKLKHVSFLKLTSSQPKYSRQLALPNLSFEDNNALVQKYIKNLTSSRLKVSFISYPGNCKKVVDKDMPISNKIMPLQSWCDFIKTKFYPARVFT
jgi:hypothetical protein